MSYNTKNYSENGDKLVIGGTLEVLDGAKLSGFPVAENQIASVATTIADLKTDFNSLLEKLKSVGLMEGDDSES
ncbi:MAG: Head fiber protein [Acutalibacteraceae bacterium]